MKREKLTVVVITGFLVLIQVFSACSKPSDSRQTDFLSETTLNNRIDSTTESAPPFETTSQESTIPDLAPSEPEKTSAPEKEPTVPTTIASSETTPITTTTTGTTFATTRNEVTASPTSTPAPTVTPVPTPIPTPTPDPELVYIKLGGIQINIDDSLADVAAQLGKANRTEPDPRGLTWYIYNSDYSRFMMVGIKNNIVVGLYTNARGFSTEQAAYGDVDIPEHVDGIKYYIDAIDNDKIHACLIVPPQHISWGTAFSEEIYRAQERINFDLVNTFRVNYGLNDLQHDSIAEITARAHSQDMADRDYVSHINPEGLDPWDRYAENEGENTGSGENISAGRLYGFDSFDDLLNSSGHRDNMLRSTHKYLGVGYGFNADSEFKYYLTQFFAR